MELWDAYDSDFKIIPGVTLVRGEEATFAEGVYHLVCEIILKHADGTYLIMQRDPRKHYGGMWEATAGGSALRGESPLDSANRELREETGIVADRMTEVGRVVSPKTHSVYAEFLAETSCDKDSVVLQEGETVAYCWIDRDTLLAMKDDLLTHRMWQFVPELQGSTEKFFLEVPGINRKEEAFDYIREFQEYGSRINGVGGLNHFPTDYEGWLCLTAERAVMEPNEERVPAREFFLVRENDNRIVGMINIRIALNETLRKHGGHIGYSIRPTERGKGYNRVNLYLGLKVCNQYGIETVMMDADLDNPASWRTMEALGGVRVRGFFDDEDSHCEVVVYNIDTAKALEEHRKYEKNVADFRLETERLFLRPMTMNDFDALYAVLSDAEIMRHYPYAFDEARVRGWIERNRERYRQYGFGLWAVCRKDTGEMIGDCGLTLQNIDGELLPEIGYHIRADQQHKGFAKEAAAAVRDWAFTYTSYPALYSYCKYTNVASYRTAEAIGMHFEREYPDEANGTTHVSVIRREDARGAVGK